MILFSHNLCLTSTIKPSDDALSASLHDFRSKISDFVSRARFGPDRAGIEKCFDLINTANSAFVKMAAQIDHPMTQWGEKLIDRYLGYTLSLLGLLNSVTSSLSHLTRVKMFNLHALALLRSCPSHASHRLKRIPKACLGPNFKPERPISADKRHGSEKDCFLVEALAVLERIEFLAMGYVMSCLCGDNKIYMEIRRCVGGCEDTLTKEVDWRLCKEGMEELEEVKELNMAVDSVLPTIDGVEELNRRLEVVANLIQGIEKQACYLFSQVLGVRNKLLDNIRLTG